MRQVRLRLVFGTMIALALLVAPSCGFERRLVSITVTPPAASITGTGVQVQFKAVGNYIHPPDSRDITDSVVWQSSAPQVISIDATGLATSGDVCGTNITVTATGHSDPHDSSSGVVVGTATVNVKLPGCS